MKKLKKINIKVIKLILRINTEDNNYYNLFFFYMSKSPKYKIVKMISHSSSKHIREVIDVTDPDLDHLIMLSYFFVLFFECWV